MGGVVNWFWDFGDGTTSTLKDPQHVFPATGQFYNVKLTIRSATACGFIEKAKNVAPAGVVVDPHFDFISSCDSGHVRYINTSVIYPADTTVQFEWEFGDGSTSNLVNPVHSYASGGVYNVKLTIRSSNTCLNRTISRTLDFQTLDIQVSPGQTIDVGQTVQLSVSGGSTFQWKPATWLSNASIANPVAQPQDNVTYVVTAKNDAGCVDIDSVKIHVNLADGVYVPGGFTPGNDGLNDFLRPILSRHYVLERFIVYNRWGQQIFTTSADGKGWDGNWNGVAQVNGVYVWIVIVKDLSGRKIEKKGTTTLIR
jgi:gliding motility-associated-like protein